MERKRIGNWKNKLIDLSFYFVNMIAVFAFTFPSIYVTQYTYPVQDDFHYANRAMELMKNGMGIFQMSIIRMAEYYKTFCGCYSSSFFGYFFSGIIDCDYKGIHIFCFGSLILFYVSIYFFTFLISKLVLGFRTKKAVLISSMIIISITCMLYYAEQEDFYWFITSVQYLFLMSLIFIGAGTFVLSLKYHNRALAVFSSILGIIGSGAALNIAAFCCILFFVIAIWGIYCKEKWQAVLTTLFPILGAVINAIAPGNFTRYGAPVTLHGLTEAICLSGKYAAERIIVLIKGHPIFFFIALGTVLIIAWQQSDVKIHSYKFPLIITGLCFAAVVLVIFPVMLGYGWECYLIICRSNFISDIVIILGLFLSISYWCCWFLKKYSRIDLKTGQLCICVFVLCIGLYFYLNNCYIKGIAVYRQIVEIKNNEYEEYADYWMGVYDEIEHSSDSSVTVYRQPIEDRTCLIDPQFFIGEYDPQVTYGNGTIAKFYQKEAVYLVTSE